MTRIRTARIDDRLVHGQVIIKWLATGNYNRVIIVDEDTASDPVLKSVMRLIFPERIALDIFTVQDGIECLKKLPQNEHVMLLVKNLSTLNKIYLSGIRFESIIIGRIPAGADKIKLHSNVFLSKEDIENIKVFLKEIPVIIQMVPDSEPFYITQFEALLH